MSKLTFEEMVTPYIGVLVTKSLFGSYAPEDDLMAERSTQRAVEDYMSLMIREMDRSISIHGEHTIELGALLLPTDTEYTVWDKDVQTFCRSLGTDNGRFIEALNNACFATRNKEVNLGSEYTMFIDADGNASASLVQRDEKLTPEGQVAYDEIALPSQEQILFESESGFKIIVINGPSFKSNRTDVYAKQLASSIEHDTKTESIRDDLVQFGYDREDLEILHDVIGDILHSGWEGHCEND